MTRHAARAVVSAALLLALVLPASAQENREWSLQKFRPAIHALGGFSVEAARVSHELTVNAYMMMNYARGLLQAANDDDVVTGFGSVDLVASIAFLDHLSVGFNMPIHVLGEGTFIDGRDIADASAGDLRLSFKATALPPWRVGPGIGLALDLILPTGSRGGYAREEGVAVMPRILLDAVTAHVHLMTNIFILSRTTRFKPDTSHIAFGDELEIGPEAGIHVGLAIFLGSVDFRMLLEGRFESRLNRFFERENTQLEFTWGLHWRHASGFAVGGGASFGALRGWGDPDWRVFMSAGYQPAQYRPLPSRVRDSDGDGIPDDIDQCPYEPEDFDGFEDEDGCPDPDNDGDGICDPWVAEQGLLEKYAHICKGIDKCPNEPETFNGFEDEDGCPDENPEIPDRDRDGIPDAIDQCPDDPEDHDGFQDEDGCPEPDNDGDGICDPWVSQRGLLEKYAHICKGIDRCPNEPEDFDGFQDEDGCPEPDNDRDGIPDVIDQCPNDPEDIDGFQDADGCPDPDNDGDGILDIHDMCPNEPEDFDGCQDEDGCPEPGKVCVTKEAIVISERVFFKTGRAVILERSYSLLDEVAQVIMDNPHIKRVEVQGHTDNVGGDRYNQQLSEARARSVTTYLLSRGVDPTRLVSRGYGLTRPIADNNTEEGRAANRRVEFRILEQDLD